MADVESFRCKLVSYDEISRWTMDVARQVQASGFRPTVIVGLTRGGWVPARLLCDTLSVKKLYAVKTEHWGVTANQNGKALLTQELSTDVKDESVLIVDDITDTGESLKLATAHLMEKQPQEMKTSTLLHITHSSMEPDFYSVRVPEENWTWFIFPWNLHEDMRTLLPKTLTEPRDDAGIRHAFKDQFKIGVPLTLVRSTLKELTAAGKIAKTTKGWTAVEKH